MKRRGDEECKSHVTDGGPHPVLCDESISDHFRQRAVVADRPRKDELDVVLDALVHDARAQDARLDRTTDSPHAPDRVDGAEMVLMSVLDGLAAFDRDSEARTEESLLDVVGRQRVAGEHGPNPAFA